MIVLESDSDTYATLSTYLVRSAPKAIALAMGIFAAMAGEDDCGPFALLRQDTEYAEEHVVRAMKGFHEAVGVVVVLSELEGGEDNHSPCSYGRVVGGPVRVLQVEHHTEKSQAYKFLY